MIIISWYNDIGDIMIKAIEIMINSGVIITYNCFISYTDKICYLNDKKYEVTDDFSNNIKKIILYWKNEYGTNNLIDADEFTIIVHTTEGQDKYHGKGIYPDNYRLLKEMLGDLYG